MSRVASYIVIHHWGGWPPETRAQAVEISKGEGFSDIPYNWIVTATGEVWPGRPETGCAANLGLNGEAIAICFLGNFDSADNPTGRKGLPMTPTDAQLVAGGKLLGTLMHRHPRATVILHRDVVKIVPKSFYHGKPVSTATACPGDRFVKMRAAELMRKVASGYSLPEARRLCPPHP